MRLPVARSGPFSAAIPDFIVEVDSRLQPDPDEGTAVLPCVLIYKPENTADIAKIHECSFPCGKDVLNCGRGKSRDRWTNRRAQQVEEAGSDMWNCGLTTLIE